MDMEPSAVILRFSESSAVVRTHQQIVGEGPKPAPSPGGVRLRRGTAGRGFVIPAF